MSIDRKILENLVGYVDQILVAGRSEEFAFGFTVASLHNIIAQDEKPYPPNQTRGPGHPT